MFDEESCQKCGVCFQKCPFLQLPIEDAKEEISIMIETRKSRPVLKNCVGCGYCNIICPTGAKPTSLFKELRLDFYRGRGVRSISLITEEVPYNLMSISLGINREEKLKDLQRYENPPKSKEMFYVGCGIPYYFQDLAKTKLLEDLPLIGGIKYCCGGYVHLRFDDDEVRIKGLELYEKFKNLGIEKLITFCPECENMIRVVYPSIIEDFDLEGQNIIEYFVEQYHKGKFNVKNKINQRITFQDPCAWRNLDRKTYEAPREFLEIIGAEVVEMKHHKEKSLCCGAPITESNAKLAAKIGRQKISEAEEANAEALAHICTGCFTTLSKYANEKNIKSYYITELAQMAIGETPEFKILENSELHRKQVIKTISENPNLLTERYTLKKGKVVRL